MLRAAIFGSALFVALAGRVGLAAGDDAQTPGGAQPVDESGDGAAEADTPAAAAAADSAPAKTKRRHRSRRSQRHGRFAGRVVPEDRLRQEPLPLPSGNLELRMLGLTESVKVNIYNEDGSYNIESLRALDHVLRCRRTDDEKPIEPRLFTLLSHIYDHFGEKPIDIVSGYRNQRKKTSNHYKGTASDIRIAGVTSKRIEAFAETLDTGGMGIGIYPRSQFVHIDVRALPSYRWTDYSPPNPNAPEKRPPRGWKRADARLNRARGRFGARGHLPVRGARPRRSRRG
jgi:uncharacterized protein YcbK (DUF882 family)